MYRVDVMSKTFEDRPLFSQYFKTYEEALEWIEATAYIRNHETRIEYEEGES